MTPTLVYGFDPLCGWCYAFGPTLRALRETFADRVAIEIACGGLVVGDRVRPMREMRDYLREAYPRAEARSGVRFGRGFTEGLLNDDDVVLASEPACRAIVIARELGSREQTLELATRLIDGLYDHGLDPTRPEVLERFAREVGLPGLTERWSTEDARARTTRHFEESRAIGISMYPTLLLRSKDETRLVLRGYASVADALERVEAALTT